MATHLRLGWQIPTSIWQYAWEDGKPRHKYGMFPVFLFYSMANHLQPIFILSQTGIYY